jgi:hypothetical protein
MPGWAPAIASVEDQTTQRARPIAIALQNAILGRPHAVHSREAEYLGEVGRSSAAVDRQSRENLTVAIINQLGFKGEATQLLRGQLEKGPSARLRGRMVEAPKTHCGSHPQPQKILEHRASSSDPDAGVATQAPDGRRGSRIGELNNTLKFPMGESCTAVPSKSGTTQKRNQS